MSEWKPIETAPTGREIILYEPEVYNRSGKVALPARLVIERWPTHYPREATHWMELPPPPPTPE